MLENEAKGDSIKLQPLQTGVDIVGDTTAIKEKKCKRMSHRATKSGGRGCQRTCANINRIETQAAAGFTCSL